MADPDTSLSTTNPQNPLPSPGFPVHDFYCEERAKLLAELHQKMNENPVPASFWALLQVCDLDKLKKLVQVADIMPEIVKALACTCSLIPKKWNQKYRGQSGNTTPVEQSPVHKKPKLDINTQLSSPIGPDASGSLSGIDNRRDPKAVFLAKKRDGGRCILTEDPNGVQGAHIFPHSLLNTKPALSDYAKATPDLWEMLRIFWPEKEVDDWRQKIFSDADNPNKMIDGPFNVITLRDHCHSCWTGGMFGLRPVSRGENELTVQFLRFPKVDHGHHDPVLLTKLPDKYIDVIIPLGKPQRPGEPRNVEHGDEITIRTNDPEKLPLPHAELLEMHWKLNAVVALSAAAEPQDLDYFYDDNDDFDIVSDVWWRGSVASPADNDPTSQLTSLPSSPGKAQHANAEAEAEVEALESIT